MGKRKIPPWQPVPGADAAYIGKGARLLKQGRRVSVIAQASGGRMVVQAIGHKGEPVTFTVAAANLGQPQPDLFD